MAFRLVASGGEAIDPAGFGFRGSGTIHNGGVVDFSLTGGTGVYPSSSSSTNTMVFGVAKSYLQGASDTDVLVVPFTPGQIWEADCVNAATTAQIGIRHALNDDLTLRNTATAVTTGAGVFFALAMVGSTSGSGKLLGIFEQKKGVQPSNTSTFA